MEQVNLRKEYDVTNVFKNLTSCRSENNFIEPK